MTNEGKLFLLLITIYVTIHVVMCRVKSSFLSYPKHAHRMCHGIIAYIQISMRQAFPNNSNCMLDEKRFRSNGKIGNNAEYGMAAAHETHIIYIFVLPFEIDVSVVRVAAHGIFVIFSSICLGGGVRRKATVSTVYVSEYEVRLHARFLTHSLLPKIANFYILALQISISKCKIINQLPRSRWFNKIFCWLSTMTRDAP